MSTFKTIKSALAVSILAAGSLNADSKFPANENTVAVLGQGFDSVSQSVKGSCVKNGKIHYASIQNAKIVSNSLKTREDLEEALGISANIKAKFGIHKIGVSGNYLKEASSTEFTSSSTLAFDLGMKTALVETTGKPSEVLTDEAKNSLNLFGKPRAAFHRLCGDEFVSSITRGAKLFLTTKVNFSSAMDKEKFSASLDYSNPFMSINSTLDKMNASKREKVTVSVLAMQLGGDPKKLGGIFIDSKNGNAINVTECSASDMSRCKELYDRLLQYAATEFPNQLSGEYDPTNPNDGAADITYNTSNYDVIGLKIKRGNPVQLAVLTDSRTELSRMYGKISEDESAIRTVSSSKSYKSKKVSRMIKDQQDSIASLVQQALSSSETCFNNGSSVRELAKSCANVVNKLSSDYAKLVTVKNWDKYLNPEKLCNSPGCDLCVELDDKPVCLSCNVTVSELTGGNMVLNTSSMNAFEMSCNNMPAGVPIATRVVGSVENPETQHPGGWWPILQFETNHMNRANPYVISKVFPNATVGFDFADTVLLKEGEAAYIRVFTPFIQYWPAIPGSNMYLNSGSTITIQALGEIDKL